MTYLKPIYTIFKRELLGYFRTPVAYVFLAVFLVASVALPWFIPTTYFDQNQAGLRYFFTFTPWIFLILIPAAGMRLWSEEKRSGTWELLFTMPITTAQAVFGKFLAAWVFIGLAILLTFTMPITVAYLGDPDWGPIFTSYFGAFLMAGAYLGICSLTSSLTKNQVISFVVSVVVCLGLVLLGFSLFNNALLTAGLDVAVVDALSNFSFMTHFDAMQKGLITVKDLVFFLSIPAFCLYLNILVLER